MRNQVWGNAVKTKIICFANNKGGSGKTTTCSNVAYCLNQMGKRVLMLDGDMQLNLSLSFLDEEEVLALAEGEKNLYRGLLEERDLSSCVVPTAYEGLDLIPSSMLMSEAEEILYRKGGREDILKKGLSGILEKEIYDYILIDAPPTLGIWVRNILQASGSIVIPVEASPWGLFGLANMITYIEDAVKRNEDLKVLGIVLTKVNTRKNYFRQTLELLNEMEVIRVFNSYIRIDSNVEWAQDNSKPVAAYRKSSRSAVEYQELTKEIEEEISKQS